MNNESLYCNVAVSPRIQQQQQPNPGTSAAEQVEETKESAKLLTLQKVGIAVVVLGLLVVVCILVALLFMGKKVQAEQAAENKEIRNNILTLEESMKNESQASQQRVKKMLNNIADNFRSNNQNVQKEFQEINSAVKENHKNILKKLQIIKEKLIKQPPTNCSTVDWSDAKIRNGTGGVFDIYPPGLDWHGNPLEVYCDTITDGGGWLVFQRRMDGSVDFYRNWTNYVTGFGNKEGEYWLGLETLHKLTSHGTYELRVDLEDWNGNRAYAKYSSFEIGDASSKYRLNIGSYSGTAGNALSYNNENKFSTFDQDNDVYSEVECAKYLKGAWWYRNCGSLNLNGIYISTESSSYRGIKWDHFKRNTLKFTEMKIRLVQ